MDSSPKPPNQHKTNVNYNVTPFLSSITQSPHITFLLLDPYNSTYICSNASNLYACIIDLFYYFDRCNYHIDKWVSLGLWGRQICQCTGDGVDVFLLVLCCVSGAFTLLVSLCNGLIFDGLLSLWDVWIFGYIFWNRIIY